MKIIDMNEIPQEFKTIALKNEKFASLRQVISTRVNSVNKDEDILVYKYDVPCPVCNSRNSGFSYDGKFFGDTHINCKYCGIYFRPIVKN
jgi:transcription elongation factor Elf1